MKTKAWTHPRVKQQVHLGCEINSYASAEI